jgi:hypothetical protein
MVNRKRHRSKDRNCKVSRTPSPSPFYLFRKRTFDAPASSQNDPCSFREQSQTAFGPLTCVRRPNSDASSSNTTVLCFCIPRATAFSARCDSRSSHTMERFGYYICCDLSEYNSTSKCTQEPVGRTIQCHEDPGSVALHPKICRQKWYHTDSKGGWYTRSVSHATRPE